MPTCPHCNREAEPAEYLETDKGHAAGYICTNEDCSHYEEYVTG